MSFIFSERLFLAAFVSMGKTNQSKSIETVTSNMTVETLRATKIAIYMYITLLAFIAFLEKINEPCDLYLRPS